MVLRKKRARSIQGNSLTTKGRLALLPKAASKLPDFVQSALSQRYLRSVYVFLSTVKLPLLCLLGVSPFFLSSSSYFSLICLLPQEDGSLPESADLLLRRNELFFALESYERIGTSLYTSPLPVICGPELSGAPFLH